MKFLKLLRKNLFFCLFLQLIFFFLRNVIFYQNKRDLVLTAYCGHVYQRNLRTQPPFHTLITSLLILHNFVLVIRTKSLRSKRSTKLHKLIVFIFEF